MNTRGQRSYDRTLQALTARSDHAGYVSLSHRQLALRNGLHARQTQSHVLALEAAGKIARTVRRGLANAYRVLAPWVLAMIDGETRAGEVPTPREAERTGNAAASQPAPPSPTRRPPWSFGEHLEHHPSL